MALCYTGDITDPAAPGTTQYYVELARELEEGRIIGIMTCRAS